MLATRPALLSAVLGDGASPWSPTRLFAASEPGAWYDPSDLTTLFQDAAGTTPVTAVEQPVGLMLDKRNTPYSVFFDGSGDAFTCATSANWAFGTGDFTVEAWVYRGSATATGPVLLFVNATAGFMLYLVSNKVIVRAISVADVLTSSANLTQNAWVHVAVARSGTTLSMWLNGSRADGGTATNSTNWAQGALSINSTTGGQEFLGYFRDVRIVKGTALYDPAQATIAVPTAPLAAVANTVLLTCGNSAAGNPTITVAGNPRGDGLNPFSASTGAHATASGTARPTLRARYNLLTYSEQFDNAAWAKNSATVTANAGVAPDGTTTADLLYHTSNAPSGCYLTQSLTSTASVWSMSFYAKASGKNVVWLYLQSGAGQGNAYFDLSDGTTQVVAGSSSSWTATMTAVGNGWYRCMATTTTAFSLGGAGNGFGVCDAKGSIAYTASGTNGALIWGGQLLTAADVTATGNAYQRIAAATDYDTTGFLPYLAASGAQAMSTPANVNLSSTDKVTVLAGVTKLSDAASGFIAELSASSDANNGAFAMVSGNATYTMQVRGNQTGYYVPTPYAAPRTDVLTMLGDIGAASLATEVIPRINGVVVQTGGVGTAGTGNYGSYPLYLFARNAASFFLTGRLYALIVRGAATDAGTLTQAEAWVNTKTRAY